MHKMSVTNIIDRVGDHQDYVDDVISDCGDEDVLSSVELDRDTLWDLHHAAEMERFFNENGIHTAELKRFFFTADEVKRIYI
jgi:hypothetical protein